MTTTPGLSCPRCGSPEWVAVSLDGGVPRRRQCIPCGTVWPGGPVRDVLIAAGWTPPEENRPAGTETTKAVATLATALDNLVARFYRDLHVDSSYVDLEGAAASLVRALKDFSAYVEECLGTALGNPAVKQALRPRKAPTPPVAKGDTK